MNKSILGLSEPVTVQGTNGNTVKIIARIDTGATSSSIDSGLAKHLELGPVLHLKTVKSASGVKKREIMKVNILLKEINLEEEFTLADRSHMTYPMLIGQNILKKGNFLIDPLKKAEDQ